MRTFEVEIGLNAEGKVVAIQPVNPAPGEITEYGRTHIILCTKEDDIADVKKAILDGCHTYKRVNQRIRQLK